MSSASNGTIVCHNITILGDDIKEEDETFRVTLTTAAELDTIEGDDHITLNIIADGKCNIIKDSAKKH